MKYVAALLILFSASAGADGNNVLVLHLASQHFQTDADLNESNPGLGFRKGFGKDLFVLLGAYRNSREHTSAYIGAGKSLYCGHRLCFNGLLALITGYRAQPVLPALVPEVVVDLGATELILSYIPKYKDINEAVVTVSLGFAF